MHLKHSLQIQNFSYVCIFQKKLLLVFAAFVPGSAAEAAAGTMRSCSQELTAPSAGCLFDWLSTDRDVITACYKGSDK